MVFSIALTVLGLVLLFLEFFLPGSLMAVVGGLLIVGGITLFTFLPVSITTKLIFFFASVISTSIICKLALYLIRKRKKDGFYLPTDQEGFVASSFDNSLVGEKGEADSDLKPAGYIQIKGKRYQAVSDSSYVNKGEKIEIIGGEGGYLTVKKDK